MGDVQQFSRVPGGTGDGEFALHGCQHGCLVELQVLTHAMQELKGTAGVIPDFESGVREHIGQTIHGALRRGVSENTRDAAADGEVLLRIQQRVHQLAHRAMRVYQQERARRVEGLVPRQETNRLRQQQRIERQVRRQRGVHSARHSGAQIGQARQHRVLCGLRRRDHGRLSGRWSGTPPGSAALHLRGAQDRGERG